MSGEIINLNQFRKAKAKAEKESSARENRRKHGRSKAEKRSDDKLTNDASKSLDGKKVEDDHDKPA